MNDPETNVEPTTRLYLWRVNKRGHRVHIENPETERTFCQVENCGGRSFDGRGAEIPPGRRLCGNCIDLAGRGEADYQEPRLSVLLGERLAEVEPELFTCGTVPKPREREKQTRPAHTSKGRRPKPPNGASTSHLRKPKRSNAKYAKPFDDPLPW